MIKRYVAVKDTAITNAFKSNLTTRGTGSNAGESDTLPVFHIYAQATTSSHEYARALFEFPISTISTDRSNGNLPASGSVSFFLNLYNAEHPFTVPRKVTMSVQALSQSFDEGQGMDTDGWSDNGIANWTQASSGSSGYNTWTTQGGDFLQAAYVPGTNVPQYTYYFPRGTENMSLDVTSLVEEWLAGTVTNNGLGVFLTASIETATSSSYLKRFFARGTEFFYKRPVLEARWNDSIPDDRYRFYASSSMLSAENSNTLVLYNHFRGQLRDISGYGSGTNIYLQAWTDPSGGVNLTAPPITASWVSTGVYTASFALDTSASVVYDRWFGTNLTPCFTTGSGIDIYSHDASEYNPEQDFVLSVEGLRSEYSIEEKPRFRIFTKQRGWYPTIYSIATGDAEVQTIHDLYYKVSRTVDDLAVVDYGTGSLEHTKCSYDLSGSYFDFDMRLLEPGYMYELSFVRKKRENYFEEMKNKFRFRVEE